MLMTTREARKFKDDALGTCISLSSIYVTKNHRLCVLESFKCDKEGIKEKLSSGDKDKCSINPSYQYIWWSLGSGHSNSDLDLSRVCVGNNKDKSSIDFNGMFGIWGHLSHSSVLLDRREIWGKTPFVIGLNNWTELWEKVIPKLVKQADRIGVDQSQEELSASWGINPKKRQMLKLKGVRRTAIMNVLDYEAEKKRIKTL